MRFTSVTMIPVTETGRRVCKSRLKGILPRGACTGSTTEDVVKHLGQAIALVVGAGAHVVDRLADGPKRRNGHQLTLHQAAGTVLPIGEAVLDEGAFGGRDGLQDPAPLRLVQFLHDMDRVVAVQLGHVGGVKRVDQRRMRTESPASSDSSTASTSPRPRAYKEGATVPASLSIGSLTASHDPWRARMERHTRMKRGPSPSQRASRFWCGREDSNFHGVAPTATSTLRVYQFRHDREIPCGNRRGCRYMARK